MAGYDPASGQGREAGEVGAMDTKVRTPRYHESGTVARRVQLSTQRVNQWADELDLPIERTSAGTRLWTEQAIEELQRTRAARLAARAAGRDPRAA